MRKWAIKINLLTNCSKIFVYKTVEFTAADLEKSRNLVTTYTPNLIQFYFSLPLSDNSSIPLMPRVATQCGFSMEAHWPESAVIYASLLNCFARSEVRRLQDIYVFRVNHWALILSFGLQDGMAFTTTLKLRLLRDNVANEESYLVEKTCLRSTTASREIVCERNYMEASDLRGPREGHAAACLISGFIPPSRLTQF